MTAFAMITKRLVLALTALIATSVLLFSLLMLGPDPLAQLQQESDVDTSALAEKYGWNKPWPEQYATWALGILHGDWGESVRTGEPAGQMILDRAPLTLSLTAISTLLAGLGAIIIGAWTASRRDTKQDRFVTSFMVITSAMPSFIIALLLQWLAVKLKDTTGSTIVYVGGMPRDGGIVELIQRLALPVMVLTLLQLSQWMRYQRSELIGVLEDDVTKSAKARGLSEHYLLKKHAIPRTLAPLLTLAGMELGTLIGGSVIVETIFGIPGLGRLLLDSVQGRDVVVALDIVVLGAAMIIIATAVIDIITAKIDPRISLDVSV